MHTPSSRPSLFWPIVLIGVGVIFLLSNLGVITSNRRRVVTLSSGRRPQRAGRLKGA